MPKRIIYKIAPEFTDMDSWVRELPVIFNNSGETIFKSRNEVKIFRLGEYLINVKAFKIPNWINRSVYVYLRRSKAERSFNYALKFQKLNIPTPKAVGFVECLNNGLLYNSFYISLHCKYDFTLREVLNYEVSERDEILRQWIRFTFEKLHKNNIYHLDYSPGNTLINRVDKGYEFNIIDLNRMKFINVNFGKGLQNFRQLDTDIQTIKFIAAEYALIRNEDPDRAFRLLKKYHLKNVKDRRRRMNLKRNIRKFFRFGHAC